jgi:hypothetical protein
MALVFDTILKHTENTNHSGLYIKDYHLINKIKETIKNGKHDFVKLI